MKKNLLFVVAIFLATTLSAQLYVGAKLGYGLGANKYEAGTIMAGESQSIEWGSMGQGMQLGLKAGYFFNDNLGFELGIDYFMSYEGRIADVKVPTAANIDVIQDVTAKSKQLRLIPQLVLKTDMGVYSRFGIILPVIGTTTVTSHQEEVVMAPGPIKMTTDSEIEYKGKFSIGFAGAVGYQYEISDDLHVFGELQYTGLTIRGATSEVVAYSINDIDQLPGLDIIQKETTFVDELSAGSNTYDNNPAGDPYNTTPDTEKAKDVLRTSTVYSSYGINIGITMAF